VTATSSAPVTAESVRADLERAFRRRHITVDPAAAADLAMGVVLPVLQSMAAEIKKRDVEIERLRGLLAEYVITGKKRSEEGERRA
jgi:hypothetical protein